MLKNVGMYTSIKIRTVSHIDQTTGLKATSNVKVSELNFYFN